MVKKGNKKKPKAAKQKQKTKAAAKPDVKNLHSDDLHGTSEELDEDDRVEIASSQTYKKDQLHSQSGENLSSTQFTHNSTIEDDNSSKNDRSRKTSSMESSGGASNDEENTSRDDHFSHMEIEQLYDKYVKGNEHLLDGEPEEISAEEMSMMRSKYMSDFDNTVTRYVVGQAMSQLQYEQGFKYMKEYLEPGELRQLLANFYYDYHRIKLPNNERVDLNKLFQECTVDTLPDMIAKDVFEEQKKNGWTQYPEQTEQEEDCQGDKNAESSKDFGDMEIGLYGWGHYLQPELKCRHAMKEMAFWYKLKLAHSRIEGMIAALRWVDREDKKAREGDEEEEEEKEKEKILS